MLLGSWQKLRDNCVFLNGKALAQVNTTSYVGLIIDKHLTWKSHVNYVIRCKLYALHRLRPLLNRLLSQAFILTCSL